MGNREGMKDKLRRIIDGNEIESNVLMSKSKGEEIWNMIEEKRK